MPDIRAGKSKEQLFLTASQVEKAVRQLWQKNGCVVLSQIRNGTGFERAARTGDMLALQTWPSRGLSVDGIEIKVSRSDLRSELGEPAKAESIAQWCSHWWLATPEGLTDADVIPDAWGIIHINNKLIAKVTKQPKVLKPKAMDALFVASVIRNFSEAYIHRGEIADSVASEVEAARKNFHQQEQHKLKRAEELRESIEKWEAAHGLNLINYGSLRYDAADMGRKINLLMALRDSPTEALRKAGEALAAASKALEGLL